MPGPLDLLKRGWNAATTPLVSPEDQELTMNAIDAPSLDRSPMEASLRGFAAGAMKGFGDMSSPASIAGLIGGGGGAMGGLRALGRAGKVAGPTLDIIDTPAIQQVAPAADDVTSLIGDMQRNLAKIPRRGAPQGPASVTPSPEFVPQGGEAAFNAVRPSQSQQMTDIYQTLMPKMGGRGR